MKQYPYTLQVKNVTEPIQTGEGHYMPGNESWETVSICRDEDGKGKYIRGEDGSANVISFVVYTPKGTPVIQSGKTIRVMDNNEVRCSGKVLYSRNDRLNSRIWV